MFHCSSLSMLKYHDFNNSTYIIWIQGLGYKRIEEDYQD